MLGWILQNSYGKRTMRKYSHLITYNRSSRYKYRFLLHFAFFEAIKVFRRTLKGTYLTFRSIFDQMNTIEQKLRRINVRMSIICIGKCFTSGSDLTKVGDGDTFIHIFTYKFKNKTNMNTNFTSMHIYES